MIICMKTILKVYYKSHFYENIILFFWFGFGVRWNRTYRFWAIFMVVIGRVLCLTTPSNGNIILHQNLIAFQVRFWRCFRGKTPYGFWTLIRLWLLDRKKNKVGVTISRVLSWVVIYLDLLLPIGSSEAVLSIQWPNEILYHCFLLRTGFT